MFFLIPPAISVAELLATAAVAAVTAVAARAASDIYDAVTGSGRDQDRDDDFDDN